MSVEDDDSFSWAGDVIKALFDKISPKELHRYSDFHGGWEDIAGKEIAFHVVPKDIVNGALILEADHPGWSQKIHMSQEGILREIRTRYPELEIRKLRVRIGEKHIGLRRPESIPVDKPRECSFFDLLEKMKRPSDS